jgi:hypothetical protein
MSDEQLQSMTEQEIRARFRCAPAYYLQAKLDKKRALERRQQQDRKATTSGPPVEPRDSVDQVPAPAETMTVPRLPVQPPPTPRAELPGALPNDILSDSDMDPLTEPMADAMADIRTEYNFEPEAEPESLDLALPGFEILDAALVEFDDRNGAPETSIEVDLSLTQQAILEAALEDYGNWPFLSDPKTGGAPGVDPEVEAWFELEVPPAGPTADSRLEDLLQQLLDSEPDLDLVLDADPELEEALAAEVESASRADNVMHGDFGNHGSPTVRVVSVAMDRKRPNMVRVVGESSRLAS